MRLLKQLFIAILVLSLCALLLECMVLFNVKNGSPIVDPLANDYPSVSNDSIANNSVEILSNVGNSLYDPQRLISMLKLEIFELSEQCLKIQNTMREDEIHIKLLTNRGYKVDSPEVLQKLKEQSDRKVGIENKQEEIKRLENKLVQIEQEIKEVEERTAPRNTNKDLERELYLWQQYTGDGQDHLLQINP